MQASKAVGENPVCLAQALLNAQDYELGGSWLAILHTARQEERQHKAYQVRNKAYKMISRKVEEALMEADLSKVEPAKLVSILLQLASLTREDGAPNMQVRVGYTYV